MYRTKIIARPIFIAFCALTALQAGSGYAGAAEANFFDAALCNPPYALDTATALYEAAEKLAKPDMSSLGAAIYKLPHQIGRDGFESDEVLFAGSAVGDRGVGHGTVLTRHATRRNLGSVTKKRRPNCVGRRFLSGLTIYQRQAS